MFYKNQFLSWNWNHRRNCVPSVLSTVLFLFHFPKQHILMSFHQTISLAPLWLDLWFYFLLFPGLNITPTFFPSLPSFLLVLVLLLSIFCKLAALVRHRVSLFGKKPAWGADAKAFPSLSSILVCHALFSTTFLPFYLNVYVLLFPFTHKVTSLCVFALLCSVLCSCFICFFHRVISPEMWSHL